MKFVIALVSYLESLGYDTSSLRKSADGSKAIVHMQYAEILSKNLDTNANVTIYDRVNPDFQALLASDEWNGNVTGTPNSFGDLAELAKYEARLTAQVTEAKTDMDNFQIEIAGEVTTAKEDLNAIVDNYQVTVNQQLEQAATAAEVEIERARITNLATLTAGSTTGDAELIDGRLGADAVAYPNIGDAIRNQFGKVNNEVDTIKNNLYANISKNLFKIADVAETTLNGITYRIEDGIFYLTGTTTSAFTLYIDLLEDIPNGNYYFNNFETADLITNGTSAGLIRDVDYGSTAGIALTTVTNKTVDTVGKNIMNRIYIYFPNAHTITNAVEKFCLTTETTSVYIPQIDYGFVGITSDLMQEFHDEIIKPLTLNVNCWGDSLTMGAGAVTASNKYPAVLQTLIPSFTVNNYGVGGQSAEQIALRMSAIPAYLKPLTIPVITSVTDVPIELFSTGGFDTNFGNSTFAVGTGVNDAILGDFKGPLVWDNTKGLCFRIWWNPQIKVYSRPLKLYPASALKREDIAIIWVGTNNTSNTAEEIIAIQKRMVESLETDRYLIIGLTAKVYFPDIVNYNKKMYKVWGDKFLDIRSYMLNYGLSDAGITPTGADTTAIENGEMPPSLIYQVDGYGVHFNDAGYPVIANQMYKKGKELGYWA